MIKDLPVNPNLMGQARVMSGRRRPLHFIRINLFAVVVFTAILSAACTAGSPVLDLRESEADLGDIVNGEVISLEIPIRNVGADDLVIEAVTTSCGCTTADVQPSTISPGDEGRLHIRFDSGAHGPEANGVVMRQIFIASNDPQQPETVFRFTANVLPPDS